MRYKRKACCMTTILFFLIVLMMVLNTSAHAVYQTSLLYSGYIQDSSGDIDVGSFSVPVVYDWNSDGLEDLLVGLRDRDVIPPDGGYISYFENTGTNASSSFESSTYIQACSDTCRLSVIAWACQGAYPSVVDWNNDGYHDLLVGDSDGYVTIFLNTNNNVNPILDSGTTLLNIGDIKAKPVMDDWNGDGKKDLLVGNYTGTIQIYLNEGTDESPVFSSSSLLQSGGTDFNVRSIGSTEGRSGLRIYDWNQDGLKDIMVTDYEGYVYYLENAGTNAAPLFSSAEKLLIGNGDPLKFDYLNNPVARTNSHIFLTDWNEDGRPDVILGGIDGKLELYMAVAPEPLSSTLFIFGSGVLGFKALRKKLKKT